MSRARGEDDPGDDSCNDDDSVRKDCGELSCCIPLSHCPTFCHVAANMDVNITIRRQLQENMCGFKNGEPMACCPGIRRVPTRPACKMKKRKKILRNQPLAKPTIEPFQEQYCGSPAALVLGRITGGSYSSPGEWPWMAAMKYCMVGTEISEFLCSGVLISQQWVLTAGHCIDLVFEGEAWELVEVRLGDTNLNTEFDCFGDDCEDDVNCVEDGRCAPKHQSFKPISQVKHPRFKQIDNVLSYDMALVKLNKPVAFTNFVRPICLPNRNMKNANSISIVTAWGNIVNRFTDGPSQNLVKRADTLQMIHVNIIEKNVCENDLGLELKLEHVCAGTGREGEAVCQGDSGGALVSNPGDVWFLKGIVSFGVSRCGDPRPAVFSRLNKPKLKWITRTVDEMLPKTPPV